MSDFSLYGIIYGLQKIKIVYFFRLIELFVSLSVKQAND